MNESLTTQGPGINPGSLGDNSFLAAEDLSRTPGGKT